MAGQRQQGWPVAACWEDGVVDAARQVLCRWAVGVAWLRRCAVRRRPRSVGSWAMLGRLPLYSVTSRYAGTMPGVAARAASYACGHVDNARALPTCPQAHHQLKPKDSDLLLLIVVTRAANDPLCHYLCCRWAECLFTHGLSIHLDDTLHRGRSVPGRALAPIKHEAGRSRATGSDTSTQCCGARCVTLPLRR